MEQAEQRSAQPEPEHSKSDAARSPEELTVSLGEQSYSLQRAAAAGRSEHALNELPVTLRCTSILHEVSSSNRLGIYTAELAHLAFL